MALLTKKQIEIITLIALNQSTSKDLYDELCEWNEKQQPAKFEPDWSTAPDYAVMVAINISWLTESGSWTHGYRLATYDRPSVAHPHAALMTKYAEVAQRRRDPWVEFQVYSDPFSYWVTLEAPTFFDSVQRYRHIGDDK
jgi:hypothetical protein